MNKKGIENLGIGTLIVLAVAIIVCLTLLTGGITSGVGQVTQTTSFTNVTYTSAAIGSSINIPYQAVKGTVTIVNATSGTAIPSTNYTITNYVVNNGQLVTTLTSLGGAGGWQGKNVNITATTVEPFGYDTNAGGRVMANLILIFAALALFIAVLVPIIKNGVVDFN
jgi:hypothetical protein